MLFRSVFQIEEYPWNYDWKKCDCDERSRTISTMIEKYYFVVSMEEDLMFLDRFLSQEI